MNLFSHLHEEFGKDLFHKVQQLEEQNVKLVKQRNQLKFNLHCKNQHVITASLNIVCPVKTEKGTNIIKIARKALLNERIRLT